LRSIIALIGILAVNGAPFWHLFWWLRVSHSIKRQFLGLNGQLNCNYGWLNPLCLFIKFSFEYLIGVF